MVFHPPYYYVFNFVFSKNEDIILEIFSHVTKGETARVPYQRRTNVCLALIIQDSVWIDWFVLAESQHHEGLASRFLFPFAQGRMVGPLRLKDFYDVVYKPLVKKFFSVLLSVYSPTKDVLDPQAPVGKFTCDDTLERFIKHARVVCKKATPASIGYRRKFVTGLQKSGYWIPGIAWENCMFSRAFDAVLADIPQPSINTNINLPCLAAATHTFMLRYSTGYCIHQQKFHFMKTMFA